MLAKSRLNSKEVLVSRTLIDSNVSHDKFALTNNVLKEFFDVEEEIKILMINKSLNYIYKQWYLIAWSVEKVQTQKL